MTTTENVQNKRGGREGYQILKIRVTSIRPQGCKTKQKPAEDYLEGGQSRHFLICKLLKYPQTLAAAMDLLVEGTLFHCTAVSSGTKSLHITLFNPTRRARKGPRIQ